MSAATSTTNPSFEPTALFSAVNQVLKPLVPDVLVDAWKNVRFADDYQTICTAHHRGQETLVSSIDSFSPDHGEVSSAENFCANTQNKARFLTTRGAHIQDNIEKIQADVKELDEQIVLAEATTAALAEARDTAITGVLLLSGTGSLFQLGRLALARGATQAAAQGISRVGQALLQHTQISQLTSSTLALSATATDAVGFQVTSPDWSDFSVYWEHPWESWSISGAVIAGGAILESKFKWVTPLLGAAFTSGLGASHVSRQKASSVLHQNPEDEGAKKALATALAHQSVFAAIGSLVKGGESVGEALSGAAGRATKVIGSSVSRLARNLCFGDDVGPAATKAILSQ